MGLDLVELVMRLEVEFDVEIPESFFTAGETPTRAGALFEYILQRLDEKRQTGLNEAEKAALWVPFRWIIADQIHLPEEDIRPEVDLVRDLGIGR
jgi:hypothetical protein